MASGETVTQHTRTPSDITSETHIQHEHQQANEQVSNQLLHLLSNSLVLDQTLPYLPISSVLSLAATNRAYRDFIQHTPTFFRHLDLTQTRRAQFDIDGIDHGGQVWRNVQVDENLTEDEFYSGPLRGITHALRRRDSLRHVHTLVLDGLSVTAELVNDLLLDPDLALRILSIRECKNLNENKLMQTLRYACRPTRADGSLRLEGLYIFGKKDQPLLLSSQSKTNTGAAGKNHGGIPRRNQHPNGAMATSRGASISINWNHRSQHALLNSTNTAATTGTTTTTDDGDEWYQKHGRIITRPVTDGWADTVLHCRGAIRFDAPLCTGPAHRNSSAYGRLLTSDGTPFTNNSKPLAIASFAVGGCATCGVAPEGFTTHGETAAQELPLLSPLPLHSSSAKVACRPSKGSGGNSSKGEAPRFVPRCLDCIRERYCFSCDQWWCESCYEIPSSTSSNNAHSHGNSNSNAVANNVQIVNSDGGGDEGLMAHELAAAADQQPKIKHKKISRSCWECDLNCDTCIADTQKMCRACGGGYCIIHYEGSTQTLCDWCSTRRGRRYRGDLY